MIADLIRDIEQGDVRFDLEFASTPRTLLNRLTNNKDVQRMCVSAKQSPDGICVLLERARNLYDHQVEPGYLHPDDMVLAIYLYLIGGVADPDVLDFVALVAMSGRPCFMAARWVAKHMLSKSARVSFQSTGDTLLLRALLSETPLALPLNAPRSAESQGQINTISREHLEVGEPSQAFMNKLFLYRSMHAQVQQQVHAI